MNYFVFNIAETCSRDESLNEQKVTNLDKIIFSILGQNGEGLPGEIRHFKVPDDMETNKVNVYRNKYLKLNEVNEEFVEFITGLANDLLSAELIEEKDGTRRRHKLITPGILIIKHETNKFTLLKLEETSSIDKYTYELINAFMTDRRYYKAAIITSETINVIDKNKKVANYWAHDFLGLIRERDDKENTMHLIKQIQSDSLLSKEITDVDLRKEIINIIREKALTEPRFEPDEWLEGINNKLKNRGINFKEIESLFEKEALMFLDESFEINKKIVKREFKTIIEVSPDIKVEAINIDIAIKSQKITFEHGYLQIMVPEYKVKDINNLFKSNGVKN